MKTSILHGHRHPNAEGLCVVIDVIRAFTTAAYAFAAGAKEIIFVSSIDEAFQKHKEDPSLLLMGELNASRIEGFHYENSPYEMSLAPIAGRRLVQRTSSGTQGVLGCSHASSILVSSFVIAEATLRRIREINPDHVSFIATGLHNGDEDLAFADYMSAKLNNQLYDLNSAIHRVRNAPGAIRMCNNPDYPMGSHDLDLITRIDHFPFAIEVFKEDGNLIGRPVESKNDSC